MDFQKHKGPASRTTALLAELQEIKTLLQVLKERSGPAAGRNGPDPRPELVTIPASEYAGQTLAWLLRHDRPYLDRIADGAQDAGLREAAR